MEPSINKWETERIIGDFQIRLIKADKKQCPYPFIHNVFYSTEILLAMPQCPIN